MYEEKKQSPEEIKARVLTENTAQGVLNHLKALESNRARMLTRWIWELLQNARDTASSKEAYLIASVEYKDGELIFQHNGPNFKIDEIAHLIYHGSTKTEDEGTIGQYGSGFLTTHLLSPTIDVSGQLDSSESFQFRLRREVNSVRELSELMDQAWNDFNSSLSYKDDSDGFTTRFRYPIGEDSVSTVEYGLATLRKCAPYVVIFNKEFSSININSSARATIFK